MNQQLTKIWKLLEKWNFVKSVPIIPAYFRKSNGDEIYNWLVNDDKIDLHKYCLLLNYALTQKNMIIFVYWVLANKLYYFNIHKMHTLDKYMIKFYKGVVCNINELINIEDNYVNAIFPDGIRYDNLNKPQAMYLLSKSWKYKYGKQYPWVDVYSNPNEPSTKNFILECKSLGIDDDLIKSGFLFEDGAYEKIIA